MRRIFRWPGIVVLLIGIAALGAIASLTISKLEERDTFCIACHTLPEIAYQQRAVMAAEGDGPAPDLSSSHYGQEAGSFRCIDCHRGANTLLHRLLANGLAARDTLIWLTGGADPALEKGVATVPMLLNAACVGCHKETLLRGGFENHFHHYLPEAHGLLMAGAEAVVPPGAGPQGLQALQGEALDTSVSCVDCHQAHVRTAGAELQGYLDLVSVVYPACEMCHTDVGRGPLQLSAGGSGAP
jgi:nitrate/TMAO reductase-like tetraheme cytochrome c subunit